MERLIEEMQADAVLPDDALPQVLWMRRSGANVTIWSRVAGVWHCATIPATSLLSPLWFIASSLPDGSSTKAQTPTKS